MLRSIFIIILCTLSTIVWNVKSIPEPDYICLLISATISHYIDDTHVCRLKQNMTSAKDDLENCEFESFCFIDKSSIENSFDTDNDDIGMGELIVDRPNYRQILIGQINQLQRNNKMLIEIERQYKQIVTDLIETVQQRDRTVLELNVKLTKNYSNFIKLQKFLKTKLNDIELYRQKYLHERFFNLGLGLGGQHESCCANPEEINEGNEADRFTELRGLCLCCENQIVITSSARRDNDCQGIVLDE